MLKATLVLLLALAAVLPRQGFGQVRASSEPGARESAIAVPRDVPFRGTIGLEVVATDSDHQVFAVHETIPVQAAGELTLLYPQWELGSHAPTASVAELAGLVIRVDGKRVEWRRGPVAVHAFHLVVPKGASTITLDLQFLARAADGLLRPEMVVVPWHRMLLYPAGWFVRNIPVAARPTLPPGLHLFGALEVERVEGETTLFKTVSLERLVDAPVYAGRFWKEFDLAPGSEVPVRLDLVADAEEDLAVAPNELEKLRAMVVETGKVFGPPPFRHYDAIVSLSDRFSAGGIEHLEEGESNLPAHYFTDSAHQLENRDLIAHEYVHAWNGRYRQPADLWSPNYNGPVAGSLLWVYEGQTEYWGRVLAARAGLRTREETLDKLALDAALLANRSGREWKTLADSTNDAIYMAGHPVAWRDWQRREDYYAEGVLLWLDVDARLRELTKGARSLDDFAHSFFVASAASDKVSTYTFADVCAALKKVAPEDWETFLSRHLETHEDAEASAGLKRAGWRLVYTEEPTETFRQDEDGWGVSNLDYSIGVQVRADGTVRSVVWNGPAFQAGLAPGAHIKEVSGEAFSFVRLGAAVKGAAEKPVALTFETNGGTRSATLNYRGTLRYPRLERIEGTADLLSPILSNALP